MGKLKKLLGFTAFLGVAVGGAAYYKKKNGMKMAHDNDFEDDLNINVSKDKKVIDISTEGSDSENKKVTITFNKDKAKQVVNDTLDDIGDAMFTAKDKIVDTIGEEHIEDAKHAASQVKNKIVDTIGEDNINKAKSKITDVTDKTKEKASEIFTDENLDYAKDKVSNALDKTKDVIKKATDKVKSMKDTDQDDFDTFDDLDDLEDLDDFDDMDDLEDLDIIKNDTKIDMPEEIPDAVAPQTAFNTIETESSGTAGNNNQVSDSEAEKPKDSDVSRYDFLADEVDDL